MTAPSFTMMSMASPFRIRILSLIALLYSIGSCHPALPAALSARAFTGGVLAHVRFGFHIGEALFPIGPALLPVRAGKHGLGFAHAALSRFQLAIEILPIGP